MTHTISYSPIVHTVTYSPPPCSGNDAQQQQQHLYGIYYNDDYDYLQHLRSVDYASTELELVSDNVSPY